jgi:hypothetical protein
MLVFAAVIHLGRDRFDAINVMSGAGDERSRSLSPSRRPSPARY